MLDEKAIAKIMRDANGEIRAAIVEKVKANMSHTVEYEIGKQVSKIVEEFVVGEFATELQAALLGVKPAVLQAACTAASEIGDMLATAMVENMKEKLGQPYKRQRMLEAITE